MKWNEMKWNGMEWNETKRNETKRNETKRNETKWNEMKWNEMSLFVGSRVTITPITYNWLSQDDCFFQAEASLALSLTSWTCSVACFDIKNLKSTLIPKIILVFNKI